MGSAVISKNGETLYYFSAFEDKYDLWKMDLRKKEIQATPQDEYRMGEHGNG